MTVFLTLSFFQALRAFLNARKHIHGFKVSLPVKNNVKSLDAPENKRTIKILQAYLNGLEKMGDDASTGTATKATATPSQPQSPVADVAVKTSDIGSRKNVRVTADQATNSFGILWSQTETGGCSSVVMMMMVIMMTTTMMMVM